MENTDTKNPLEQSSGSHISPVDARWLTANVEEVNRSYSRILELIESGVELSSDKSDDACEVRRCQLIAHIEQILQKHQVLAEQYVHLQSCNNDSSSFYQQNVGDAIIDVSNECCFQTPDSKSFSHYVNVEAPSIVSSQMAGGGSFNTSEEEGSEYSAVSSDSDFELYEMSAYKSAKSQLGAHRMLENHFVDNEEVGCTNEGQLGRRDHKIANSNTKTGSLEMELDLAKLKLESSEEEITKLKSFPSKKNSDDCTELKNQLELAQQQVAMLDAKLDGEKRQASEMQDKIQQYISDIANRDDWICKLKDAVQEVTDKSRDDEFDLQSHIITLTEDLMLTAASSDEWKNRCESLKEQLQQCEADMAEMRMLHEVQEIRWKNDFEASGDEWRKWCESLKEQLQQCEADMAEMQMLHEVQEIRWKNDIEASSDEWKKHCESLKEQLQQCEADMGEMRMLHEVQEIRWKNDIDLINTELNEKVGSMEILNKDLDTLKLKYDTLEAEKVGFDGKIKALRAGLCAKDDHIWRLENLLHHLDLEKVEIISASDSAHKECEDLKVNLKYSEREGQSLKLKLKNSQKEVQSLKLNLKCLEKEVQSQNVLISDRAEEKREAIRQLCFTIEYYRNCYEELLQASKGFKATPHC